MELSRSIARNLDEPARILGLSPLELASCAVFYAILSIVLKGVPLATLLSFGIAATLGVTVLILNRTYPPHHGVFFIMHLLRSSITPVMAFGPLETKNEYA
jgi:hypothetical protein